MASTTQLSHSFFQVEAVGEELKTDEQTKVVCLLGEKEGLPTPLYEIPRDLRPWSLGRWV